MTETIVTPVWDLLKNPTLGQLNDFRVFLYFVWKHLGLPKPTPVQLDIAKWLQEGPAVTNGRMIIEAFRGVGKTWVTVAFVCWCLLMNPTLRVLVVSKTGDKAKEIIFLAKRLLKDMPVLSHLNPDLTDRSTTEYFDVNGAPADVQPSVKALGIDGQLPGNRANIIIPDDVETLNNCLTLTNRERLDRSVAEFDAILKPGGIIIYLGTPQIEDSLYSRRANAGYTMRIWPARYPNTKQLENAQYRTRLAPWIVEDLETGKAKHWTPTDVVRFSSDDLTTRELSYGKAGFLLQFQLDTSLSDADRYPLKLRDLSTMAFDSTSGKCPVSLIWTNESKYALMDPNLPMVGMTGDRYYAPGYVSDSWEPFERVVMAIDPSGSGTDETGWVVVGLYKGWLYLLAAGGYLEGHSEHTMVALAKTAQKYKVNRIRIERNFGDGMFTQLLKPHLMKYHPCEVEEERSSGQKERRMCDVLEPIFLSHRLVVLESVIQEDYKAPSAEYQMFYQLTRLTRERGALAHEDRAEALAMAVADMVEYMAQDTGQTEADFKKAATEKMMLDFLASMEGREGTASFDRGSMRYVQ